MSIQEMTDKQLDAYRQELLRRERSPATIANYIRHCGEVYPHAESRYTIPRSDQCKKVPFCACGRRRKARYESVHTPCKTFGLFGQPSEILDRVSCIFFVYLFHTE